MQACRIARWIGRRPLSAHAAATSAAVADVQLGLAKTSLYDMHVRSDGKMVPFGGYSMPLQYPDLSITESVNWVRTRSGLFDVGHMVQHVFRGTRASALLEQLTPCDTMELQPNQATLSVLLNADGGILDDLMITKLSDDEYYVVTNAGRRAEDSAWFDQQIAASPQGIEHEILHKQSLIAVQGPQAAAALQHITSHPLESIKFGHAADIDVKGIGRVFASRGGYTGEDGFEISIKETETAQAIAELLLRDGERVKWAGLAARDVLRLEAGLCLYGNDIDETTSPIEAGLAWTVKKRRRETGGFLGYERIMHELQTKTTSRKRVGILVEGAPARSGAEVYRADNPEEQIGIVTSGLPSPTLGKNIAIGYLTSGFHQPGTKVSIKTRGRLNSGTVTRMPFVPTRYFK